MPHQCVKCSNIIPLGSKELLDGCASCGGRFFFYVKEEHLQRIKEELIEIPEESKKGIEKDIREMAGIVDEDMPVILDLESIRATGEGKFELDLVKLFKKDRPLIYKLEEGKYIIDLASTLKQSVKSIKGIRNPDEA
ncbi:MAG TPA: Zn-ribbon containing protein [Candidatus Nanoarchaeia archaeon]|nr:Zn-ribbon containing protein [Candidatus Nanoarchaeia archaeon]